jgi:hypothetical protein
MRVMVACAFVAMISAILPTAATAACKGPTKVATGPTGITLTVCLDGKYSTCVRDSRRLGWHEDRLLADCGRKREQGFVK